MTSLLLYTTTCHECYGFGLTPESKRILAGNDSVEVRELSDGRIVESCQACDYESVTDVDPYADITIVDKPVPKQVVPPSSPLAFKEQGVVIVDVPKTSCTWDALNGGSQYGPMPRRNLLDAINAVGIESIVAIKKRDKRLGGVSVKTLADNPPKVQGVFGRLNYEQKKRTWPLVDALRLHHETPNGQKSIDSWTEKLLVEICAGHKEGKTYRELSDGLGVGLQEVKAVIRVNKKLEN